MFNRNFLMGPLRDSDPNPAGGGGGSDPAAPAQPVTAFDPDAFKAEILSNLDKKVNSINNETKKQFQALTGQFGTLTKILEGLKPAQPSNDPAPEPSAQPAASAPPASREPNPPAQPASQPQHQSVMDAPEYQAMQRRFREMEDKMKRTEEAAKKKEEAAMKQEVDNTLTSSIGKHRLSYDRAPQDLFSLLRTNIVRGEDGLIYGPDGMTVDEYVKQEIAARPTFIPPKVVNGAGAQPAIPIPTPTGHVVDDSIIKPGMTPEEWRRAASAIGANMAR